jgi:hypothetical protein
LDLADGRFGRSVRAPEVLTRGFAALAYKRNLDFGDAEREYVTALRLAGTDWTLNSADYITHQNFQNMMVLYDEATKAVLSRISPHEILYKSRCVLVGLLSVCGYDGEPYGVFRSKNHEMKNCRTQLKTKYSKSAKVAWKAVLTAFSQPTLEDYHDTLLSYRDERVASLFTTSEATREKCAEMLKCQRSLNKESARSQKSNAATYSTPVQNADRCDNCDKVECRDELKYCPCHNVKYCSKVCQVAHFPQHKISCAHILRKKQQQKQQQQNKATATVNQKK